jgi:alpha-tubulin suppressor-like RCC1 family protein
MSQFRKSLLIVVSVSALLSALFVTQAAPSTASTADFSPTDLSPSVAVPAAHGSFVSQVPHRILDTRSGSCVSDPIKVQVANSTGVPPTATAVALNVTVVTPSAAGFLTVWPYRSSYRTPGYPDVQQMPLASNLNYVPGQVVPNMVVVGVGGDSSISIYASAGCPHVVVDVAGWFSSNDPANGGFEAVTPSRALDTRVSPQGPCVSSIPRNLPLAGTNGVPADATSVALNVTVVSPSAAGFLTVWPSGEQMPLASNLNFMPGQVVPNMVIVKLGSDGAINLYSNGGCPHVVVDVAGWFAGGTVLDGGLQGLTPSRALDTRNGQGCISTTPRTLHLAGTNGVPANATAVALNVTVVSPSGGGYLTVWPSGTTQPLASNLNYVPGQVVPNMVLAQLGSDGSISIYTNNGCPNVVVDVAGWFAPPPHLTGIVSLSVGATSVCGVGPVVSPYSFRDTVCWGNWYSQSNAYTAGGPAYNIVTAAQSLNKYGYPWDAYASMSGGSYFQCGLVDYYPNDIECFGFDAPRVGSAPNRWVSLSSAGSNLCAVDSGGSARCVGVGTSGQLGNGSWISSQNAVTVTGISTASKIAVGGRHSCALITGGSVKCWGNNSTGALGNNSTISTATPISVTGISGASAVVAGFDFSCALVSGQVFCWGAANALGGASQSQSLTPVTIPGVTGATQLTAGDGFVCALLGSSQIKCWGSNYSYELGNGTTAETGTANFVVGISNATQVSAKGASACALLATTEVKCWGLNNFGLAGIGDMTPSFLNVPKYVLLG